MFEVKRHRPVCTGTHVLLVSFVTDVPITALTSHCVSASKSGRLSQKETRVIEHEIDRKCSATSSINQRHITFDLPYFAIMISLTDVMQSPPQ